MTNIAKAVLHGSGVGEEFAVQCNYQLDAALSLTEMNAIVAAWAAGIGTTTKSDLLSLISTDQSYDQFSLYYYATTPNDPATYVAHAALTTFTGTGTAKNPLQLALCVTTRSDFAGASHRGRMYLPFTGIGISTHLAGNTAVDTATATAQLFIQDTSTVILTNSSVTSARASVFSPKLNNTTPITSVSADNIVDIQRRRAASQVASYRKTLTVTTA